MSARTVGEMRVGEVMPFPLPEGIVMMGVKTDYAEWKRHWPKRPLPPNHSPFAVPTPDGKTDWWCIPNDAPVRRIDTDHPERN